MKRAIIIGIDGFDPIIINKLLSKKQLPHIAKLTRSGSYCQLTTTNPAQSPVAWASLATGVNPGKHGVYDFIHRDPQTYLPYLSITKLNKANILGLRSKMYNPVITSKTFWQMTTDHNIPTTVIKWPLSFPPDKVQGKLLSGLGVPDIKNTLGRYTLITSQKKSIPDPKGDMVTIDPKKTKIKTHIPGPAKNIIDVYLDIDRKNQQAKIEISSTEYIVQPNKWSDWIQIKFKDKFGREFWSICKCYLQSIDPDFNLYISSLNIDPQRPICPISYPDDYAAKLVDKIGLFHSLGMPEETNGVEDGIIDLEAFYQLTLQLQQEREQMFWYEFNKFKRGLFAFVFDTSDRLQHMFWFTQEKKKNTKYKLNEKFSSVISGYYQRMDKLIGQALSRLTKNDLLMVLSDHGFSSFSHNINLNTWLIDNKFMTLNKNQKEGKALFADVDWKKTRAYALGFSSIYLNRKNREKHGIVDESEVEDLSSQIARQLLKLKDIKNNSRAIHQVYFASEIYDDLHTEQAPDLIVGTRSGYRVSSQTAIGAAPQSFIQPNDKPWCGDHLVDPSFVPGILLCNQKINKKDPSVLDIVPTILEYFQLSATTSFDGLSLINCH